MSLAVGTCASVRRCPPSSGYELAQLVVPRNIWSTRLKAIQRQSAATVLSRQLTSTALMRCHSVVGEAAAVIDEEIVKDTTVPVKISVVTSTHESFFGPPWIDVMEHIAQRLAWVNPQYLTTTLLDSTVNGRLPPEVSESQILLAIGVDAEGAVQSLMEGQTPGIVLSFDCSPRLQRAISLDGYNPTNPGILQRIAAAVPGTKAKRGWKLYQTIEELWGRKTTDDFVYLVLLVIDQYVQYVPEVMNLDFSLDSLRCMMTHCRKPVLDCLMDPQCRTALTSLNKCGTNDQVCSYRVLVSYESTLLQQFSLCILQKHNCLGCTAQIPMRPDPQPMKAFRGQEMTHTLAEDLFIGWLGDKQWSWKVVCGKSAAYDCFPCQYQLFYRGKAKNTMWYDPVFKVFTLDGKECWRRRHYRVKRAPVPGTFYFSVLDNGVTSNEFWRIVYVKEDLSWGLFYYAGAAAAAGLSYTGAVLVSSEGQWPSEEDMPDLQAALEKCGIKVWELFRVNNSCELCQGAPIDIPQEWVDEMPQAPLVLHQ